MNKNLMPLKEAGYREKVFAKAWIAVLGSKDVEKDFRRTLDTWLFNASKNVLVTPDGTQHPVKWEGSQSREVLDAYKLDDSGCHQVSEEVWTIGRVKWETSFKDFFFHKEVDAQAVRTGDKPPYMVVTLRRDGWGLTGEQGRVDVALITDANQITGKESEAELWAKIEDNTTRTLYCGPLEKAEGFAQGVVDGLQLGAGLALVSPPR